jgi:hypothetical protein
MNGKEIGTTYDWLFMDARATAERLNWKVVPKPKDIFKDVVRP